MTSSINLNDVIKHIYPIIDEGGLDAYLNLTEPERVFFATWPAGCEICNGGFPQYYRDSYSFAAVDAPDAYRRIGAPECARIIESANLKFGSSGPNRDRNKRKEQLDAIPAAEFEKLEDEFYKCDEDTTTMLEEFVAENIEHFSVYSDHAE